ncbi:MAG: acyl-CoA thioesterase [Bacteroidales bacterium]|nr:acyl-CoA thioesterase [Bacteroidales bacterium]
MFTTETSLEVRYYECDQMGIVHHSNYVRFFECGRNQMMRELGIPIEQMEKENIMFPVVSIDIHFKLPSRMGDTLKVFTTLTKLPMAKLIFDQKITNQKGELLCFGTVTVGFISADKRIPIRAPKSFVDKVASYFPEN